MAPEGAVSEGFRRVEIPDTPLRTEMARLAATSLGIQDYTELTAIFDQVAQIGGLDCS